MGKTELPTRGQREGKLARHNNLLYDKPHVLFPEGKEVELVDVENVEDAAKKYAGVGIEIVQSGSTLRENGLAMVSLPLLQSETIITHTTLNGDICSALEQLCPLRYNAAKRQEAYREWYSTLEASLRVNWLNKPTLDEMNIDKKDFATWAMNY